MLLNDRNRVFDASLKSGLCFKLSQNILSIYSEENQVNHGKF